MKKNLITALKKLVTSCGGSAKSNNAVDLVDEFADVAGQGGGGSGDSIFIIKIEETNINQYTADKTFFEVHSTWQEGKPILFKYGSRVATCNQWFDSKSGNIRGYYANFIDVTGDNDNTIIELSVIRFTLNESNVLTARNLDKTFV